MIGETSSSHKFNMAAVVSMVSRCGLIIEACPIETNLIRLSYHCRAKPLASYSHFQSQLYISNKIECFSYKGGCMAYAYQGI